MALRLPLSNNHKVSSFAVWLLSEEDLFTQIFAPLNVSGGLSYFTYQGVKKTYEMPSSSAGKKTVSNSADWTNSNIIARLQVLLRSDDILRYF